MSPFTNPLHALWLLGNNVNSRAVAPAVSHTENGSTDVANDVMPVSGDAVPTGFDDTQFARYNTAMTDPQQHQQFDEQMEFLEEKHDREQEPVSMEYEHQREQQGGGGAGLQQRAFDAEAGFQGGEFAGREEHEIDMQQQQEIGGEAGGGMNDERQEFNNDGMTAPIGDGVQQESGDVGVEHEELGEVYGSGMPTAQPFSHPGFQPTRLIGQAEQPAQHQHQTPQPLPPYRPGLAARYGMFDPPRPSHLTSQYLASPSQQSGTMSFPDNGYGQSQMLGTGNVASQHHPATSYGMFGRRGPPSQIPSIAHYEMAPARAPAGRAQGGAGAGAGADTGAQQLGFNQMPAAMEPVAASVRGHTRGKRINSDPDHDADNDALDDEPLATRARRQSLRSTDADSVMGNPQAIQPRQPPLAATPAPEDDDSDIEYIGTAPSANTFNWALPKFEVSAAATEEEGYAMAKVSIPGIVREEIMLSPDHAAQELHLFTSIFLPAQQVLAEPDPEPATAILNFHTIAVMVIEAFDAFETGDAFFGNALSDTKTRRHHARDADPDDIFLAVLDKWRIGKQEGRQAYALVRGVQEFCDIALDIVFWIKEEGLLDSDEPGRKERSDKGMKRGPRSRDVDDEDEEAGNMSKPAAKSRKVEVEPKKKKVGGGSKAPKVNTLQPKRRSRKKSPPGVTVIRRVPSKR
ncbi:hypothetical protein BDV95DRAFT_59674 [Massariosphaeria phaeospora]|uniref:Uncharacterized protein n=1 Tax=Massariosphaeria phaeospora TaxID=100035 RepID=A0A7C8I951_9PLEO|nr:hypothetical protein BDV95DRAFT_59674 [Massariosphaeria phaeospora]